MSLFSDVRTAVRKVCLAALSDFTNPQAIYSHLSGTEPAESYVVVNILSIDQQGHHATSTLATVGEKLLFQVAYQITVQFSFIGSMSGDMAQSFVQNINNNPLTRQVASINKLGFMRKSVIRRAPQKRDTKWVEYHNLDVIFNYVGVTSQTIDVIEGVVLADELSEVPLIIKIPESIIYP